jgi:hypothetical protein
VIYAQGLFFNFVLRLVVHAAIFLIMFYLYYIDFEWWFWSVYRPHSLSLLQQSWACPRLTVVFAMRCCVW